MKLTEEQKQTLLKRVNELAGSPHKCALCGSHEWLVSDIVFQLTEFVSGSFMVVGGAVVPVIPMTCAKCANTLLLNAITLGLVEPEQPEPETTPASGPERSETSETKP
jgi:hypothetical protein